MSLRRSPGAGNGSPLQYSCLGNPMDRGAWLATVHGITKSQIQLSHWACTRACTHACWRRDSFLAMKSLDSVRPWDGVCFQKEFHRSWLEIISLPRRGFVAEVSNVWSQISNWKLSRPRAAWLFWWVQLYITALGFHFEEGFRCVMLWAVDLKFGGEYKNCLQRGLKV